MGWAASAMHANRCRPCPSFGSIGPTSQTIGFRRPLPLPLRPCPKSRCSRSVNVVFARTTPTLTEGSHTVATPLVNTWRTQVRSMPARTTERNP